MFHSLIITHNLTFSLKELASLQCWGGGGGGGGGGVGGIICCDV